VIENEVASACDWYWGAVGSSPGREIENVAPAHEIIRVGSGNETGDAVGRASVQAPLQSEKVTSYIVAERTLNEPVPTNRSRRSVIHILFMEPPQRTATFFSTTYHPG
jgi:hypothetical protein